MRKQTHFVIFKSDSLYSITECGSAGVKQAYMDDGIVSGDGSVLIRLSRVIPANVSIRNYLEKNAGHLVFSE